MNSNQPGPELLEKSHETRTAEYQTITAQLHELIASSNAAIPDPSSRLIQRASVRTQEAQMSFGMGSTTGAHHRSL